MKTLVCKNCGSSELCNQNGVWVCLYCGSKFILEMPDRNEFDSTNETSLHSNSSIELDNDVALLLLKCKYDPRNARKYANLILDIDPDNREALDYLQGGNR